MNKIIYGEQMTMDETKKALREFFKKRKFWRIKCFFGHHGVIAISYPDGQSFQCQDCGQDPSK